MRLPRTTGLRVAILVLAAILAVAVPAVFRAVRAPVPFVDRILLISIDTCRADALGCYGWPQESSGRHKPATSYAYIRIGMAERAGFEPAG